MSMPTVPGYISWHLQQNPSQAKQIGDALLTNALQGDSTAGLAVVMCLLLGDESEDDDEEEA